MLPSPLNHYRYSQYLNSLQGGLLNKETWQYRIIFNERRKLRIGHDAVKRPVNVCRDLAINLEVLDFSFDPAGFHEPGELRAVGEVQKRFLGG